MSNQVPIMHQYCLACDFAYDSTLLASGSPLVHAPGCPNDPDREVLSPEDWFLDPLPGKEQGRAANRKAEPGPECPIVDLANDEAILNEIGFPAAPQLPDEEDFNIWDWLDPSEMDYDDYPEAPSPSPAPRPGHARRIREQPPVAIGDDASVASHAIDDKPIAPVAAPSTHDQERELAGEGYPQEPAHTSPPPPSNQPKKRGDDGPGGEGSSSSSAAV
ncbi:hypothetical protein B0T22DRAFT_480894 [Podospora appendiculata]|uniref:Uncharacterized protein n=1 Tax=Podospora appendiculata TaxID=314037 RepID=A0AAE1CDN4_9PEZI|nr:hypothetical protein B0T22DRAFT_480894 [Podospora appendiculata]